MPRAKKSRTDYRPGDVDKIYTSKLISHIAISGGFPDTDMADLRGHITAAAKAYLKLVEEEANKQKIRNQQSKKREQLRQKDLAFDIYDRETLPRRKGRPRETSMRAFVSDLAYIYNRHSGRDPKAKSKDRRPDNKFDEFVWAVCNPLFEHDSLDHFIRWHEEERKKLRS